MTLRIEDYALIGDCKTAALVGRDGSIDWLCWPRFDSAACFAALLGTVENGRWLLAPRRRILSVSRHYRPGTVILETEFETETGRAAIVDFMPLKNGANLVRIVIGRSGHVDFRNEFVVRFNYGATVPWVSRRDDGSLDVIAGPERVVLRTPAALHGEDLKTLGEFVVEAGQSVPFVLSYGPSFEAPPSAIDPFDALDCTETSWRRWSDRCPNVGRWTDAVKRSLITLKALTYAPTGGLSLLPRRRCRSVWAACGTGTTAIAGCATRLSPSSPSSILDITRRRAPGVIGSFAPLPAARTRSKSCTASLGSGGCRS